MGESANSFFVMEDIKTTLNMIKVDMENDVKKFDGSSFNGKIVAEYFNNLGAAIATLAFIIEKLIEQNNEKE